MVNNGPVAVASYTFIGSGFQFPALLLCICLFDFSGHI